MIFLYVQLHVGGLDFFENVRRIYVQHWYILRIHYCFNLELKASKGKDLASHPVQRIAEDYQMSGYHRRQLATPDVFEY